MVVLANLAAVLLALSSLLLLGFGLNLLYLSWSALCLSPRPESPQPAGDLPLVCVQLPVYNERHVARRAIEAAARLDWPRDRLEIQVLDDSDDETVALVAELVAALRSRGLRIEHLRRGGRAGYKAGALAYGLERSRAQLLAVFDADFVPPPDFLRRSVGAFDDPGTGFVQARWGHLNESYSWLTRLQALAIDFHFLVEQPVRSRRWFTNFTGTAGVWRREAIQAAGGWSSATLTEDLDLSYRAQLRGWRPAYLETLVVPEELPVQIDSYRRQQARWATGSFQTAYRLLPELVRAPLPAGVRWQACLHLLSYGVGPLMLLQLACYPFLLEAKARGLPFPGLGAAGLLVNAVAVAPWAGFIAAQLRQGRPWWRGLPGLLCQVLGAGLSATVLLALLRSTRPGGEFVRTPKYRIERAGEEWRDSAYARIWSPAGLLELALGAGALAVSVAGVRVHLWLIALYSGVFAAGLLGMALLSALEAVRVLSLRRLGGRARTALGGPLALAGVLLLPALLLAGVSLVGQPFEDSYQHWLMAAGLAESGHLRDPIFGMEDAWLPGYQLFAAAVLKLFGLHRLDLLVAASVCLALASLALLSRLAGSARRGFLAVILLALNPAFLLTSVSAVAEPLILALLLAATAAARSRRWPVAAILAALAVFTGTKAWLWLLGLALPALAAALLAAGRRRPRLYWLAPALAVLVLLQLGFAPAGHSVAKAAVEVRSASLRGSLAPDLAGRLEAFGGWFLLASAPLAVLAPFGLLRELRTAEGRERVRLLHVPSAAYLGAVTALVAAGVYSGSHRYYLLALPSLALLAAAGLEGVRPAAPLAVSAAALIAAAYLPVFTSFSAANAGLAAAGRASAGVPGRLLTDSPVAAFYSGKPPSQIGGSESLPDDPEAALQRLRSGGYRSLVLERIDYYAAARLFPQLVRGRPVYPFRALGDESAYQVPQGKSVYAYSLDAEPFQAALGDGILARIHPDLRPAAGKTAPLAKGVVLENGVSLAGEGVGFGVPIAHFQDGWYFPGSGRLEEVSAGGAVSWRKTFVLDRRESDSPAGGFLGFDPVPSRGEIEVTYTIEGSRIEVRTGGAPAGADQVVLLNEESASFDDFAEPARTLLGTDFGSWVEARGPWARLRSAEAGVEWSQPAVPGAQLRAARERRLPDLDFAGLEYVFGPGFSGTDYTITVGRAR